MKNITKLGLTALACLVLSACGSSKGGDNSAQPANNGNTANNLTPSANTPAATPTNTTPVATSDTTTTNANATGGVYILSGEDRNLTLTKKALNDASNLNIITVDGQPIRVAYQDQGISAGTWTVMNENASCCGKYSDVRFGIKYSDGPTENDYFFYNGNVTKSMPTSGSATYNGHFIVDADDDYYRVFDNVDHLLGTANFTADFGAKTLSGSLNTQDLQPINVNATINGNSFNGTAQSATFRTTADVEGKFYGTNAKELGGIFMDNEKMWGGAFGASQ